MHVLRLVPFALLLTFLGCGGGQRSQAPTSSAAPRDHEASSGGEAAAAPAEYAVAESAPSEEMADEAEYEPSPEPVMMAEAAAPPPRPSPGRRSKVKLKKKDRREMRPPEPPSAGDDAVASGESYDAIKDNPYRSAAKEPLSTFSIDVDTASYANVRRFLTGGNLPPPDAVRIEELINYFNYTYPGPTTADPFGANVEVAACPWNPDHRLARIGIKGKEVSAENRKAANLVFLLDVSGSMNNRNKLPLLKTGLKMLVNNLSTQDRVAIAVYAGASGLVLPATPCDNKRGIIEALDQLSAGGSTNAGAGIELAYKVAQDNFINGGINRVILATDGDFNVGTTNREALVEMVQQKAKQGVFLTVLGLGMGNYKDSTLEMLADKGNGNYAYIDTEAEARKVLVEEMGGTLVTIAKDVKLQIEMNPATVGAYRLIGYENRVLKAEDFTNDKKDAGEIGAGHTVTAFYEIVPKGKETKLELAEPVKTDVKPEYSFAKDGLLVVKMRYKQPNASKSKPLAFPVPMTETGWQQASSDFRFAAAVAAYGMLLRGSQHKGKATWEMVIEMAGDALDTDPGGYRKAFIELAKRAKELGARN